MEETRRHIGADARRTALVQLGSRLKNARTRAGKTQSSVATFVGTSTQAVRNWEAGRNEPSTRILGQLADLYGVSQWDLRWGNSVAFAQPTQRSRGDRVVVDPLKVVTARRLSNLTQEAAASIAGVSTSSLSRIERGLVGPTPDILEILSHIYGTPVQLLVPNEPLSDVEYIDFAYEVGVREPDRNEEIYPAYTAYPGVALDAYHRARADLSPESEAKVANFIRHVHDGELRKRGP